MRTKNAIAATATLCVLTVLTGCGNGAEDTTAEPTASESTSVEATDEATEKRTGKPPEGTTEEPTQPEESESSQAPDEAVITIEEFMYSELEPVAPGTEITVENTDTAAHTVTADGEGDFDVTIAPGASETFTAPNEAGEYPYLCTFHAGMTATLMVE